MSRPRLPNEPNLDELAARDSFVERHIGRKLTIADFSDDRLATDRAAAELYCFNSNENLSRCRDDNICLKIKEDIQTIDEIIRKIDAELIRRLKDRYLD